MPENPEQDPNKQSKPDDKQEKAPAPVRDLPTQKDPMGGIDGESMDAKHKSH